MTELVKVYGLNGKVEYREMEIPEEPEPVEPEASVEERVTALEDAIEKGLSL